MDLNQLEERDTSATYYELSEIRALQHKSVHLVERNADNKQFILKRIYLDEHDRDRIIEECLQQRSQIHDNLVNLVDVY